MMGGRRHSWLFVSHDGRICSRCKARRNSGRYVDRGLKRNWFCSPCADKEDGRGA